MMIIEKSYDDVLIGKIPIARTKATFAIRLEPDADGQGVSFRFGFLLPDGKSLVRCHSTGAGQTPLEFIALLRAAVDSLEDQARAPKPSGRVQVRDVLPAHDQGVV